MGNDDNYWDITEIKIIEPINVPILGLQQNSSFCIDFPSNKVG